MHPCNTVPVLEQTMCMTMQVMGRLSVISTIFFFGVDLTTLEPRPTATPTRPLEGRTHPSHKQSLREHTTAGCCRMSRYCWWRWSLRRRLCLQRLPLQSLIQLSAHSWSLGCRVLDLIKPFGSTAFIARQLVASILRRSMRSATTRARPYASPDRAMGSLARVMFAFD
jgi:hypothetical protein